MKTLSVALLLSCFAAITLGASVLPVTQEEIDSFAGDVVDYEIPTNPIANSSSDIEHIGAAIPVLLTKVSQLIQAASPEIFVQGVKWRVIAEQDNGTFSTYLQAADEDLSVGVSFKVVVDFKIIPVNGNASPIGQVSKLHCYWGASKLLLYRFKDLSAHQPGFVHKDNMHFLINFKASRESIWDVI